MANRVREPPRSPRMGRPPQRARGPSDPVELWVLLPASQLLLGFLLAIPFTDRFARLPSHERGVYLAAAITAANSVLLFAAPLALRRIGRMSTPGAIRRSVTTGRIALASAVILTTDIVGNRIGGDGFGIIAALVVAFLIVMTAIDLPPTDDDGPWCP